jgi:guanylate kinase
MKTRLIIVAAPSGAGKSSFVERACREDSRLVDTVTYTTRSIRKGESEGHPYHFVSKERFQALVDDNFFVEWAEVHGNMYGTPYNQLHDAWVKGKCIIMDVDIQGAATFKAKYVDAVGIFILPPSIDELRRRIEKRDGGLPKDIEIRMTNARIELQEAPKFDYRIVNDQFEASYAEFKKIIDDLLT